MALSPLAQILAKKPDTVLTTLTGQQVTPKVLDYIQNKASSEDIYNTFGLERDDGTAKKETMQRRYSDPGMTYYDKSGNVINAYNSAPQQQPTPQTQQPTFQPMQYKAPQDNTQSINQMYDNANAAAIAKLKQAIAKSRSNYESTISNSANQFNSLRDRLGANYNIAKSGYQATIDNAPRQFQGAKNQTESDRFRSLDTVRERLANSGDKGGLGRQDLLNVESTAGNRLNAINLQQESVISDANRGISDLETKKAVDLADLDRQQQQVIDEATKAINDLETSGNFEEAQLVANNANERLRAIIEESNRIENATYDRMKAANEDARIADETAYNRLRDTISDTGKLADGSYTQQGQMNQINIALSKVGLDTAKINLEALPKQIQGQATLVSQQIQSGQIDIETGKAQLKELTDPNSITNQMAKIGLDTAKLNLAALPQQIKSQATLTAQQIASGEIDIATGQAQLKELTDSNSITNKLAKLNLDTAKFNYSQLSVEAKQKAAQLADDLANSRISRAQAQASIDRINAENSASKVTYDDVAKTLSTSGDTSENIIKDLIDEKSDYLSQISNADYNKLLKQYQDQFVQERLAAFGNDYAALAAGIQKYPAAFKKLMGIDNYNKIIQEGAK